MLVAYIDQINSGSRDQVIPGARMRMDGHNKVQPGENRGESGDEDGKSGLNHFCVAEGCAERCVEGPTGVDAAGQYGVHHEDAGDDEEVPAQQIDSGEG